MKGPCLPLLHLCVLLWYMVITIQSSSLFEKHFDWKISDPVLVLSVHHVRGVMQCEKLCLELSPECVAANVIHFKGTQYSCEILKALPVGFNTGHLLPNRRGKFIRKTG